MIELNKITAFRVRMFIDHSKRAFERLYPADYHSACNTTRVNCNNEPVVEIYKGDTLVARGHMNIVDTLASPNATLTVTHVLKGFPHRLLVSRDWCVGDIEFVRYNRAATLGISKVNLHMNKRKKFYDILKDTKHGDIKCFRE